MPDFTALDSFLKAEMAAEQATISAHQAYLLKLQHIAQLVPGFNGDSSSTDASSAGGQPPSDNSGTQATTSDGNTVPVT